MEGDDDDDDPIVVVQVLESKSRVCIYSIHTHGGGWPFY